jgi:hypothetical protein
MTIEERTKIYRLRNKLRLLIMEGTNIWIAEQIKPTWGTQLCPQNKSRL